MMTSQNIRKGARSGRNVGPEPQSLTLVNEDPEVRASFEQVGCMTFCRKIQGFNMKLAEQFTLRFDGSHAVIAGVIFQVTEETLSATTEIPSHGERWFKGMPLDAWCYKDFIKRDCLGGKVETGIPSRYLQGPFRKLMEVIRKYFTCEGRFDIIHSHHIRLLMHFTGRRPLNLPFFLHQSLREMADNARAEADQPKRKISHVSLIKLLMVEELRRLGNNWDSFLLAAGIPKDPKGDFPLPAERVTSHHAEAEAGRACGGRKDIGSPVPPTTNTPEKGQAKEKQGSQGDPSPERAMHKVSHRRVTHAHYSAGARRRHKSRKLGQKEEDRHRKHRCS
jgi:hypothetical protein